MFKNVKNDKEIVVEELTKGSILEADKLPDANVIIREKDNFSQTSLMTYFKSFFKKMSNALKKDANNRSEAQVLVVPFSKERSAAIVNGHPNFGNVRKKIGVIVKD